jgi:hypothetical protein
VEIKVHIPAIQEAADISGKGVQVWLCAFRSQGILIPQGFLELAGLSRQGNAQNPGLIILLPPDDPEIPVI